MIEQVGDRKSVRIREKESKNMSEYKSRIMKRRKKRRLAGKMNLSFFFLRVNNLWSGTPAGNVCSRNGGEKKSDR